MKRGEMFKQEPRKVMQASSYEEAVNKVFMESMIELHSRLSQSLLKGTKRAKRRQLKSWLDKHGVETGNLSNAQLDIFDQNSKWFYVGSKHYRTILVVELFFDPSARKVNYSWVARSWNYLDESIEKPI